MGEKSLFDSRSTNMPVDTEQLSQDIANNRNEMQEIGELLQWQATQIRKMKRELAKLKEDDSNSTETVA